MEKTYTTKQIAPDTIELKLTLSADSIKKSYETLLANELKSTNIKGFRKGVTPREMVEPKLKPQILFEVFNRLAPLQLSTVVNKEKIELIASPEYKHVDELELGKDLTFTVHCTIMPEFKLGNMKKVKVELKAEEVKKEEVEQIMKQIEENKQIKSKKGTQAWLDEVVKMLGFKEVKNEDELKEEIKKALKVEKENIIQRQAENNALNQAIELSKIVIPDPAVHFEAHEREHSFMHQLEGMNMTIEKYTQSMGVTVQHMVDMWHKDAKEALETDVFLKMYAKDKGLSVTDSELEEEIEKVKKSNPVNPETYENTEWREYIRRVALKQKAYAKFLVEVMPKSK